MTGVLESKAARAALGAVALAALLAGCDSSGPSQGEEFTPTGQTFAPSLTTAPTATGHTQVTEPLFLFTCVTLDGVVLEPLTSLEEVWAAPGYTQLSGCEVKAAAGITPGDLTAAQREAAALIAAEVPDAVAASEVLLATCSRVPPEGAGSLSVPVLEAALLLCPEAPHAGLMADAVAEREGG